MLELKHLSKTYRSSEGAVEALKDVSLTISDGDIFGIIGMSGAGKSTLVRCINMLERPDSGSVEIDGRDISTLSEPELRKVRRDITMIFQGFNLLMQRTCAQNVAFPLKLAGIKGDEIRKRSVELLKLVGLEDKANSYPAQLSGGQQQRVAIARALATNPKILLCDEATSALDPTTTRSILELIRDINRKFGITVVIITHQMNVVESICANVAILDNGAVAEQGDVKEIFAKPQSDAAKRLVFPERERSTAAFPHPQQSSLEDLGVPNQLFIQVEFNGADAAGTPLVARMAINLGIEANIVYASMRSMDGKVYGSMLLSVGSRSEADRVIAFLTQTPDVAAEEVKSRDVQ